MMKGCTRYVVQPFDDLQPSRLWRAEMFSGNYDAMHHSMS